MKGKSTQIRELEIKLRKHPEEITTAELEQVSAIWREIVDETLKNLFSVNGIELPDFPRTPEVMTMAVDKYPELRAQIDSALTQVLAERESLKAVLVSLNFSEKSFRTELLLSCGSVRSQLMNYLIGRGEFSAWAITQNNFGDYLREFQVVPYRLLAIFTQKYFEFQALSQSGIVGWFGIAKQVIVLAFIFFLPVFVFRLFKSISDRLEHFRKSIFTQSKLDYRSRTKLALWIRRLNPFLPWILAFLTLRFVESILAGTFLEPLVFLLPYFEIYVGYRVFRILLGSILTRILISRNLDALRSRQLQVEQTAKFLSVLFFAQWALLHATQDAVRKALIFNLIFDFILVFNALFLLREVLKWKDELKNLTISWANPKWTPILEKGSKGWMAIIVAPSLFALNVFYLLVLSFSEWLSQFDIGKRVFSEIFRKRLEEAAEQIDSAKSMLPADYVESFIHPKSDDIRITLQNSPLKRCLENIDSWGSGTNNNDLLLMYGNFGIGNTELMKAVEEKISKNFKTIRFSLLNESCTVRNYIVI
ncbi:MAG: hypothetical protein R2827_13745 [Bdellovibrionales bacterium]